MKKTKKSWIFFSLNVIFMLIIPLVFIWLQYGDLSSGYKISVTAIILMIAVVLIFKKIILNKWMKTLDTKIVAIETNALSIVDEESIKANKSVWRGCSVIKLIIDCIIPLLLSIIALLTIKVVEQGLIKLYGCLIFCLISISVGIIFKIIEIFTVRLYHER